MNWVKGKKKYNLKRINKLNIKSYERACSNFADKNKNQFLREEEK